MLYRENRLTVPGGSYLSILETNRAEARLGWWNVTTMTEGFPYAADIEPPRVAIVARIGDRYVKTIIIDADQTISVLADDVSVVGFTRDLDATLVVAAVPTSAPGPREAVLTDLGLRLGPASVDIWQKSPCAVAATLWRGDPNARAVLNLGVIGPGPHAYSVVTDGVKTDVPAGATLYWVVNPGALTVNYTLVQTIRP